MWRKGHLVVRPAVSTMLAVLATLLLFPSTIAVWARTQVYNREAFADHAVEALEDDSVRAAMVRQIVDEIMRASPPEVLAIRPLIELVTATVVDSVTFVEIYRDAVEEMHRELIEGGGQRTISLTLVDAMIVITAFIQQAYPDVARQLPPNLTRSFIELRQRDWAVQVVTLGEDIDYLAFVLPSLTIALYGAAVSLSPRRRLTMSAIGLGLLATGLALAVARDLGRDVVLSDTTFTDRGVREAVWDAYTQSLLGLATIIGAFGLLLAVAARDARARVDVHGQLRLARALIARRPQSPLSQLVRAGAFLAAGFAAIRWTEQVLAIVILTGGACLLYYGLSELVHLAAPAYRAPAPSAEGSRAPTHAARTVRLRATSVALLGAAALGGVFVTFQALRTAEGGVQVGPASDTCNGSRKLCERRLDEVAFLATHNSMAAASEPGWYFAHHYTGLDAQLEAGVRAFLLDTWYGYNTGSGVRSADRDFVAAKLPPGQYREEVIAAARRLAPSIGDAPPGQLRDTYLCHAFCELGATPLVEGLHTLNSFLERHPGEVIILLLQDQITPQDTAKAFIASGLVKHVFRLQPGKPFPTLRQMIERDERVVVLGENDTSGVDWYLPAFDLVQDTSFQVTSPSEFSCARARGTAMSPLFAMNNWVMESPPSLSTARIVNTYDFLSERVRKCEDERTRMVNLVAVNFYEIGDALRVVNVLNGVAKPPARTDSVKR